MFRNPASLDAIGESTRPTCRASPVPGTASSQSGASPRLKRRLAGADFPRPQSRHPPAGTRPACTQSGSVHPRGSGADGATPDGAASPGTVLAWTVLAWTVLAWTVLAWVGTGRMQTGQS